MKYRKFIIKGYRGISDATEISITKESLIPIIGKNESGKTTCLEAINAFDYSNDDDNMGKHLINVENLYSTVSPPVIVGAEIEVSDGFDLAAEFKVPFDAIKTEFLQKYPNGEFDIDLLNLESDTYKGIEYVKAYKLLTQEITENRPVTIERDLKSKKYTLPLLIELLPSEFLNSLGESMVKALPYILYFDDFRDRIDEKVYITDDKTSGSYTKWIEYIDELFERTRKEYSVFDLPNKSDSQRRSIISEVERYLNKILTEEWAKYQFERNESIQIKVDYVENGEEPFLKFKILEKVFIDGILEDRFFDISDRSKGFYWYFNFMMKLHFNPTKRGVDDVDTVYLLDEPGSYLHTYALGKLAEQLKRLSLNNKVIYCTHFHNLLNPEFIPINSIRVAEKIDQGKIILKPIDYAQGLGKVKKNSAYQPILDALEVKPPLLEFGTDKIVLVEGIYDFYSFKMFTSPTLSYFPCVGASSIINQIPYMIFLGKKYLALWDNDTEGRERLEKAKETFGEMEAGKFLVLGTMNSLQNTRLEEYFDAAELERFNSTHLQLPTPVFSKIVLSLFYSKERQDLIERFFPLTKANFENMETILVEKLKKQQVLN